MYIVYRKTSAMDIAAFIPGYSGGTAAAYPHSRTVTAKLVLLFFNLDLKIEQLPEKSRISLNPQLFCFMIDHIMHQVF